MKSLSLSKPLLIMVVGIPGSGKSHFARQFAEVFNAPLVSFDEIRHLLFSDPQFSRDEETIIVRVMRLQILQLLKTNSTFLVDGGVNTRMARYALEKIASGGEYGFLTIWVQTDVDTAAYRSTNRSKKRQGDSLNTSMSDAIFENHVTRINPPDAKENHIVISGKHTFAAQAKTVLRKIVVPRESTTAMASDTRGVALQPRSIRPRRGTVGS